MSNSYIYREKRYRHVGPDRFYDHSFVKKRTNDILLFIEYEINIYLKRIDEIRSEILHRNVLLIENVVRSRNWGDRGGVRWCHANSPSRRSYEIFRKNLRRRCDG